MSQGHTAVVMELLDRGAVLEDPDDIGMRPLMHAAAGGRSACVSALLAREPPPDLEAHDERGRTALLHAASNGFIEALEVRVPGLRMPAGHEDEEKNMK